MLIFITIPYYFCNDINSKLTYMLAKFREMQEVKYNKGAQLLIYHIIHIYISSIYTEISFNKNALTVTTTMIV